MSDAGVRGLTLALLAVLGLYCASRLEITNSITHFLPSESEAELVELSLELVESPLTRRMVLVVGGGDGAARARAAAELWRLLVRTLRRARRRRRLARQAGVVRDLRHLYTAVPWGSSS